MHFNLNNQNSLTLLINCSSFYTAPLREHSYKFSCVAFIAGSCVLCCLNSEFTKKINKVTYKTDKNTNIFVILLVFSKQQSTQLPANMKAVISHENFNYVF
jgi:redox-regulated HSP33 family molecular chaperone